MNQKQLDFISDELENWAEEVETELKKALQRMHIGVSDELFQSIKSQVIRASTTGDGKFMLSFLEYGRMVDIGTGRGGRGKAVENRKKNRQAWAGRKPKKFYSKTAYGMLNRLIENIMYGYQEASAETVKSALQ
jgi:hypothetical protein